MSNPKITLKRFPTGPTVSGSFPWEVAVSGYDAAKHSVEFRVDANLGFTAPRWVEHQPPFMFNGDPDGVFDTTILPNGPHRFGNVVRETASGKNLSNLFRDVTVANSVVDPPPPPPTGFPPKGFAPGWHPNVLPDAAWQTEADEMKAVGAKVVRIDTTGGNQANIDRFVGELDSRGMELFAVLHGTTGPISAAEAEAFAQERAAHLKGKVRFFEFCNEPDLHGWTPEAYAGAAKGFYTGLKAGNPNAVAIVGANWKWDAGSTANEAGGIREWVKRLYAAGIKGHFDVYSCHLYDDPKAMGDWNLWNQVFVMPGNVRSTMDANGDQHIPIISTESGTSNGGIKGTVVTNALADKRIAMCLIYSWLGDDVAGFGIKGTPGEAAYKAAV